MLRNLRRCPSWPAILLSALPLCCASTRDHADDRAALVELAVATGPIDQWIRSSGWLSNSSVCDWELVGCDGSGRVKVLALSFNNMTGELPAAVGLKLAMLQDLDLEYNHLSGSLPASLALPPHLVEIGLGGNHFSGVLPPALCQMPALAGPACDLSKNPFTCPLCSAAFAHCGATCLPTGPRPRRPAQDTEAPASGSGLNANGRQHQMGSRESGDGRNPPRVNGADKLDPSPSSFPAPHRMTTVQQQFMARVHKRAAAAAAAATGPLLTFLGTPTFQAALALQSSALAVLTPAALLKNFRAALPLSEIAHGFPASFNATSINGLDFGIDVAEGATFFPNQWQLPLMYPTRELKSYYELISFLAPAAATEVGLLGLPPFSATIPFGTAAAGQPMWPGGFPANMSEASDRIVYGIFNQHKIDFPNFLWGDVALVFNTSRVHDMTLLTPVDSGDYTCSCNVTFTEQLCSSWSNRSACSRFWYCHWKDAQGPEPEGCIGPGKTPDHNCGAWGPDHTPGTLDHFEHLLLPYAGWYANAKETRTSALRLASLLARTLVPWDDSLPNMTTYPSGSFDYYFEANLAGNPPLPNAVAFAIGSLPSLFGTAAGDALRRWAMSSGWALVWSLGANNGAHGETIPVDGWPANTRMLDATVLPFATVGWNLTAAAGACTATFEAQWAKAKAARAGAGSAGLPGSFFDNVWSALSSDALLVQPMYPGLCATPTSCIGTNRIGECVCARDVE